MDLQVLKTEITTDPAGLGYAGKSDEQVAKLMMSENGTGSNFEINRKEISGSDIVSAIVGAEYLVLSAAQRDYTAFVTGAGMLKVKTVKDDLLAIYTQVAAPLSRASLQDAFKQTVSRALKVVGEPVTPSDIANARRA